MAAITCGAAAAVAASTSRTPSPPTWMATFVPSTTSMWTLPWTCRRPGAGDVVCPACRAAPSPQAMATRNNAARRSLMRVGSRTGHGEAAAEPHAVAVALAPILRLVDLFDPLLVLGIERLRPSASGFRRNRVPVEVFLQVGIGARKVMRDGSRGCRDFR